MTHSDSEKTLEVFRKYPPDPNPGQGVGDKAHSQSRGPVSPPHKNYPGWVGGAGYGPGEQIIHQFQLFTLMLPFIVEGNWELNVFTRTGL
jgi:hypothetical protein